MWFGKNIIAKLGLVLALAVPALAADDESEAFPLDPLYFPGVTDEEAQEIWSELMKYKLWATTGFKVGNRLEVKEDKGWVGTSDGDFVIAGPGALVGGPVIIGGNVDLHAASDAKGTEFLTGPLRVEKTLTFSTEGHFKGTVCVQGDTVIPSGLPWHTEEMENGVYKSIDGDLKVGETAATTGACSADSVAFVEKKMTVPSLKTVPYNGNLVAQGAHRIDVPNEEGPFDLFYESVTINSDSKLHINMPKGGRLTRIFTKSITFGNQAELQVMYDGTLLKNDEYEGMFMVYVDGDIVFENTNDRTLQGTFISSGTITTKCNMKFAGQMIANKIVIGNEIRGDDAFRYVPVVPPVIDIKPTASAMGGFIENNTTVEIPITLSTVTKNGVSFKYCFELSESSAKLDDFNVYPDKDKDGNEYPAFPVCGSCGSNCGTVDIPRNAKEPDKKVYLNVKLDDDGEEPTEKLAMKIYDLNGAVLPKNSNGLFDLNILNVPLFNFGDVDENYYINEHVIAPNDTVAQIPIEGQDLTDFVISMVDNALDEHPIKLNDLFKISIDETQKLVVITVKNHDELDYESDRIKQKYQVTLSLKDKGGVEGCKTVTAQTTINIKDINEPPYFVNFGPYEVKEHSPKGTSVGFVLAEDPDVDPAYNTLVYTIPVNEDNDKTNDVPFAINPSTGEITVAEPDKEKFDYETHPLPYVFNVEVFDNLNSVPQEIKISLIDINEPPIVIDTTGDTIWVAENSLVGVTKMAYFEVSDPDADDNANLLTQIKPTITDNEKKEGIVSAEDLFDMVMEKTTDDNGVDKYWAVLKVKADINFEAIMAARGDSVFDVTLTFTDHAGTGPDAKDTSFVKKIAVTDVNEEPYFTAAGPFDVKENSPVGTAVGEVKAADDDIKPKFNTLYYTIPVNEDNNPDNDVPFAIVNKKSGLITVANKEALDFEDPNILEHKFEFKVQVTDGEFVKDTLVTITLKDEDEPPVIIPICEGDECPTICQGDKCIECKDESCHEECVENCDKPNDPVDVLTVSVNENSRQNYEIMRYLVRDEDFDVGHSTALTAEIKNTTVNTGAEDLFGAKMEKDADGNWNVVVYVADSSKLDYETLDFRTHDVTINVRDPEDADGVHGSLLRVIKVVDVNEAPTITGVEDLNGDYKDAKDDFTFYPKEDLVAGGPVGYVHTYDPDVKHLNEFGYREFSLDNPDNYPFEMKDSLLVLTKKLDYEKDSREYTFDVIVNNCERAKNSAGKYEKINPPKCTEPVKQTVTVKLQDVNEKPIIIVDKGPDGTDDSDPYCIAHCDTTNRGVWKDSILTIGVRENTEDGRIYSETGKVLFQYHYADEDTGHVAGADVDWFVVDSLSTISSESLENLFKLDFNNGVFTVSVKDEMLLDYEKLRNAQKRDDPEPEYTVGIVVTDPDSLADTLYRTIRIIDENEKPLFTAKPCVIVEGNHPGDSIGHVEHPSDIDSLSRNPALYDNQFKMTKVSHENLFDLRKDTTDLMRVVLAALDSIDCENGYTCGDSTIYWVELTYGDTSLKTVYSNLKIPVTILDLNEKPIIKTDTIGVAENSPKGTVVDTIKWEDVDRFDTVMHFEITKDPSDCFVIDKNTGAVTVKKDKCSALDFEKNEFLEIEVAITDMVTVTDTSRITGGPNTVKKTITVNVHDVNEPPHLDDTTFTVSEFKKPGTVIDTVVGHDPDTRNPEFSKLTYSMVKGDSSKFKVNPTTGEIVLLDSLDYETKNEYKIDVRVYDGEYDDVATITIKVKNEIEKTHVRITIVDDSAKVWNDPEVVYTNNPGREICWEQESDTICQNIHITKDTVVTIEYKNPKKDSAGVDKVIIYYSNAAPMVTISAKPTQVSADNIFTILEKTGDDDSTVYVNDVKNNIYITIRDTANKNTKIDTSFKMPIVLNAVSIENKVYDKVESIIKAGVYLDETKPSKEVTRIPTNGNTVKVSYKEVVGHDTVTVTYETDKKGDVLKSKVIGDDGKEHSWEVITVSYVTKVKINGKEENVTISYLADAATGQVLEQDAEGNLMTASAAEAKRKEAKKNSAKADSSKSKNESTVSDFSTGRFSIAYSYTVKQYVAGELMESSVDVSYVVDGKGELTKNADGDRGYSVKYTYTNIFGNAAEQSLFIVLDQVLPTVEIRSPVDYQEIRSNYVNVEWYVNGKAQDTLTVQGLEKGVNMIVRFYRDKAGNEASDTVFVVMKDSKDIELSVVNPVTEINPDKVAEFYSGDNAKFAPEKGQTYSVSILSTSGKEIETLKGGRFDAKAAGGEELYPDQKQKHLGPTLGLKVQLPVVKPDNKSGTVSGLATMDDLMCHGKINLEEVCNENTKTMGVEEYVAKYCDADVSASDDLSSINLYNSRITVKIWIYTSLGGFVDYYRFSHDLNEPDYTNEAGLLQMFFELKPDREGFVRSESGKLYSTGAYLYKVEASVNSVPRCDVMPMKASSHKRGEKIKSSDDLLKPFGYKRPKQK